MSRPDFEVEAIKQALAKVGDEDLALVTDAQIFDVVEDALQGTVSNTQVKGEMQGPGVATRLVQLSDEAEPLLRNSLRNVRKMNLKYDVNEEFRVGDMVLLKKGTAVDNLKMHAKAVEVNDGPYRVLEILPQGNVRLGSLGTRRIKDVVDEKRLTRYYRRLTDEETERGKHKLERRWAIEAVVGRQVRAGAPWYKVRWLGFDKKYDRWFAQAELHEIWELVNAYDRAHGVPATLSAESREVSSEQPAADARRVAAPRRRGKEGSRPNGSCGARSCPH